MCAPPVSFAMRSITRIPYLLRAAYTVARRTREVGIRMALGATQGNVIWMVMREVLLLIAVGVGLALPASLALTKLALRPHAARPRNSGARYHGVGPRRVCRWICT